LQILEPGVVTPDYVSEKAYRYYEIQNEYESTTIIVSVTPLDDGDPDLFVSFG
jgi:hypothetical protein